MSVVLKKGSQWELQLNCFGWHEVTLESLPNETLKEILSEVKNGNTQGSVSFDGEVLEWGLIEKVSLMNRIIDKMTDYAQKRIINSLMKRHSFGWV